MVKIIVQAAYMSGDMFGVAAALKLDRTLYVLVVYDNSNEKQAIDMHRLYLASVQPTPAAFATRPFPVLRGITEKPATRPIVYPPSLSVTSQNVKLLKVDNCRAFYKSMHNALLPDATKNQLEARNMFPTLSKLTTIASMGESTRRVVKKFGSLEEKKARNEIVETWRIDDFDDLGIARFLQRFGIAAVAGGKYLFLWIRLSGRQGGAHIELDAGMHGWMQIINMLPDTITPVLIGDRFDALLPTLPRKIINLTRFWEEVPFCLYKHAKFTGAEARRSQFALFEYMLRAEYKVCHLGMRSGVLESVALMGATVLYMEEIGNFQQERIAALTKKMANYDRLVLNNLPTREGKLIQRTRAVKWTDLYLPHIRKLAKHCNEDFKSINQRITQVEQTIRIGSPFDEYKSAFIKVSIPVWSREYDNIVDWPNYVKHNKSWSDQLFDLLSALYSDTWSIAGIHDGFVLTDLQSIVLSITEKLGNSIVT